MNARLHCVAKIWDQAPHNAFTNLTHYRGAWFCTFREAEDHMSLDSRIQVISSVNGREWSSVALLTSPESSLTDLRDPKIVITPDQRLMLTAAATSREENATRRSYVWFSTDGFAWSEPRLMSEDGVWIWGITCADQTIYGAGYGNRDGVYEITLYGGEAATDLKRVTMMYSDALFPNETALLVEGDTGLAVIRRELAPNEKVLPPSQRHGTALLATSQAPFTDWSTQDLGIFIGGPALIRLPNGKIIIGGRKMTTQRYMTLWKLDEKNATLTELIILPSGNDCSYPGLFWHEDRLWVSYYSAHEGKSSIYFAEIEIA